MISFGAAISAPGPMPAPASFPRHRPVPRPAGASVRTPMPGTDGGRDRARPVHVLQGEFVVSADAHVVLTTILGSCVAAGVRDPVARVGGLNHFLLPGEDRANVEDMRRYGVHAMELLVNGLLQQGARRERLEAKLFGGARLHDGLTDVGDLNATFAINFLLAEGIRHVGGSLRGGRGRRIQFWPASGRARQIMLSGREQGAFDREPAVPRQAAEDGAVDFF